MDNELNIYDKVFGTYKGWVVQVVKFTPKRYRVRALNDALTGFAEGAPVMTAHITSVGYLCSLWDIRRRAGWSLEKANHYFHSGR